MKQGYRGNLLLVELIVVVLFFALSAMISLGVFVQSRVMERESAALTKAEMQVRTWCETLTVRPDAADYLAEQGFLPEGDAYVLQGDTLTWRAEITQEDTGAGILMTTAFSAAMTEQTDSLCDLSASCYFPGEVTP